METLNKSYYINIIESKDNEMAEVMNINFGGHHDLGAMYAKAKDSGLFSADEYAKEFVLGLRFLHHALKKNADVELFQEFIPQFEAFKQKVAPVLGCDCGSK